MKWLELVWWIFWRTVLSAAVIGGLLGSVDFPSGTVLVMRFSVPTGIAVGISTGFSLPFLTRLLYLKSSNFRMNKWIVYVLFVSLNTLFMILFWRVLLGALAFYIAVVFAPLSALPAIYFTPQFVERVEVMQSASNYRKSTLSNNQIKLDKT